MLKYLIWKPSWKWWLTNTFWHHEFIQDIRFYLDIPEIQALNIVTCFGNLMENFKWHSMYIDINFVEILIQKDVPQKKFFPQFSEKWYKHFIYMDHSNSINGLQALLNFLRFFVQKSDFSKFVFSIKNI